MIDKRIALEATCAASVSQLSTPSSVSANLPWTNIKPVDHTTSSELSTLEAPFNQSVDLANKDLSANK